MAETRLVRTIVCAYGEELPTSWVQVFHRFERAAERAGLRIRVRLLPLDDLPESFEVLVVPPDLERRARALGTEARLVTTTRQRAPTAASEKAHALSRTLVDKMLAERELCIRLLTEGAGDKASAHAMNVTVISLLMGRSFGFCETDMLDLGVGAMLHDIGKVDLPERARHRGDDFKC